MESAKQPSPTEKSSRTTLCYIMQCARDLDLSSLLSWFVVVTFPDTLDVLFEPSTNGVAARA